MTKKRLDKGVTTTFLGDIINLHINYDMLLTSKIGFLVAIAALIVTLGVTEIISPHFSTLSNSIKFGIIFAALGSAVSIVICVGTEKPEPITKVKTFHPLSIHQFDAETQKQFNVDLRNTLFDCERIVQDYGNQMLHMKHIIYKKSNNVKLALYSLIGSLLVLAVLSIVEIYVRIFTGI